MANPGQVRVILATVLSTIAVLAVLSINDQGIEKESMPHTVRGLSGNPDLKVAEAPEDTFMEVEEGKLGPLFYTDGDDKLPRALQAAAERIGEEAKAPTDKSGTDEEEASDSDKADKVRVAAKAALKKKLHSGKGKKASVASVFNANCMTLKAYAMNVVDKVTDMGDRSINVLKPILTAVAEKGDCVKQLTAEFKKLNDDQNIQVTDSIARDMTAIIEREMKEGGGILVWKNLDFQNAGCNADPVECLKLSKAKAGGNYVYIDAERVGWSGTPGIFHRLAVRSRAVVDTANKLHATALMVKNTSAKGSKAKKIAPFLTKDQDSKLMKWDGGF